jgi:hypothetical protein
MYSVKNPITNPAQSPVTVQTKAWYGSLVSYEKTLAPKEKLDGREIAAAKYNNGVKMTEEINNYIFKVYYIKKIIYK